EIIHLNGYTEYEKIHIAKKYIIPKQLKLHGLKSTNVIFRDSAIRKIIENYTREAGLRNLEREIAAVMRKVTRGYAEKKWRKKNISDNNLKKFLGNIKFTSEVKERTALSGVATGLAWTRAGGTILFIESTKMKGKNKLKLTGQLGEVMKESAEIALSYIRSNAEKLHINEDFFKDLDIHIHVPEGGVPKDGPSAGITIITSLVSLLRNKPIRHDIAMTGEISLRGYLLPVGGIQAKILAAHQAGIFEVILPYNNKKDLSELPAEIRKKMKFHTVKKISDALRISIIK
ncbi:MAG: endopeptidase La, partial [Actinomycetia bacterium]|nr:endopeptidase La [Actinomycetes bacterium]